MSSGPSLREIVFLWTSRTLCIVLWTQPARDCVSMDLYSHVDCPLEPVRFASLQERPAAREVIVSTIHTNSVQGTRSLQPPDVLACALNLISVVRVLAADRCWSYFLSLWANDRWHLSMGLGLSNQYHKTLVSKSYCSRNLEGKGRSCFLYITLLLTASKAGQRTLSGRQRTLRERSVQDRRWTLKGSLVRQLVLFLRSFDDREPTTKLCSIW